MIAHHGVEQIPVPKDATLPVSRNFLDPNGYKPQWVPVFGRFWQISAHHLSLFGTVTTNVTHLTIDVVLMGRYTFQDKTEAPIRPIRAPPYSAIGIYREGSVL